MRDRWTIVVGHIRDFEAAPIPESEALASRRTASAGLVARRLLGLLWPAESAGLKARVAIAVALIFGAKVAAVGAPLVYKQMVDGLTAAPALVTIPAALILAYGLARIGGQVATDLRQLVFAPVAQHAIRKTTLEVFERLHALSLRFHLDRQTGGVARVIHRGAVGMEFLVELALFQVAPTLLELALVAAVLWTVYDAGFAGVTLATIAGYLAFTVAATGWQVGARREMNARDVAANVKAIDSLLNYETVKYFAAEAHEAARFATARRAYETAAVRAQSTQAVLNIGQTLLITAGSLVVMLMAARSVAAGTMTVGGFVLVNAYLLQLYAPLGALAGIYSSVKQALADVEAMVALLREPPEVVDRPDARDLAVTEGRIVFDRVAFAYDPRRPILKDLSFEAAPGSTVAIVGASGGGKSTLARLLFRFYDVTDGAIRIDGQDLREVTQASLRRAVGVVPQDTVLFNDTLFYNIAYGRPDATRADVEAAARLARLDDFVRRLPEGYDTPVGERGLKLSGGEKQRVAIARLILKRPSVLVFDEATSALDGATEREIQASLREVSAGRTTLVIAHRLTTIVDADEILVLDDGRIVERGRHHDLLALDGAYAALWRRQRREAARPLAAAAE